MVHAELECRLKAGDNPQGALPAQTRQADGVTLPDLLPMLVVPFDSPDHVFEVKREGAEAVSEKNVLRVHFSRKRQIKSSWEFYRPTKRWHSRRVSYPDSG